MMKYAANVYNYFTSARKFQVERGIRF